MLIASKVLSFLGALLLALPAAYALLASRGFDLLVQKARQKNQLQWLAESERAEFLTRFTIANAHVFLAATMLGLVAMVCGFGLDLLCATHWFGVCR